MSLFRGGFNDRGRTENVIRNVNVALLCQAINTVLGFVSRSFFISMLGKTYLGINGVFANILTVLNFAELGIGTAIVYNLYQPLKDHDEGKVSALVNFYRNAYLIIGLIISGTGLALTPFLTYLIKEQTEVRESISLLYILFLASTVVSYFNAHKKSLLGADQKQHVINIYHQLVHTLQIILQMLFLYFTRNYVVYLLIQISCTVAENVMVSREADRLYPFLRKNRDKKIEKGLFCSIRNDVGALTIYKLNSAIIHGTDNILITALQENGVQAVGLYANYTLISETLNTILGIITNALTPSIGNLNAEKDVEKKERIFYTTLYLCAWTYGFACSGIMALSDQFIAAWIGSDYILSTAVVFAIALQLYIRSVHYAAYTYRVTCGLFVQSKYVPILTSILNIGLSIYLGKQWGLFGILFATSVARILTVGISDPVLVYKHVLKKSVLAYYLHYAGYTLLVVIGYYVSKFVIGYIPLNGWIGFILSGIVFSAVYNTIFALATCKSIEFKYVWNTAERFIRRVRKV